MVRKVVVVALAASSLALSTRCSSGSSTGGNGGGSHIGGSGTGGSNGGGSAAGGSQAGGSATGGFSTGGSAAGGGSGGQTCDIVKTSTCPAGQVCLIDSQSGTSAACFPGCDQAKQNCGGGLKCTYVQIGIGIRRACVDAGTVAEDQTCTQDGKGDDCQAGLFCLSTTMKCARFCNLVDAPCPGLESCAGLVNAMTEFPLICEPGCDLYAQDCAMGGNCLPAQGGGTVCIASGTVMSGGMCSATMACAKGLACVDTGTGGVQCLGFCNLDGGMPACTTGTCTKPNLTLPQNAGFCL